ncbi:MAG TPA: glycosyltransferase [Saprospiraceae bacterium]|nr:glycosyltransferase [Saprospiraceae bacterium]HMQ85911.1 glycosyltransferase [Saprospiraceae bacterium]
MIRICSTLAGAGYEVWLVGRRRKDSKPLKEQPFRQMRLNCYWEKGKLFYLEYNLRLLFFLIQKRFDLVCAVDLDTLLPAWLVARLKRKVIVYDAHEYFTEVPEVIRRAGVKKMWEGLAQSIIPRLQYAYTVGPQLARLFQERYGTPFEVIRNVPFSQGAPPLAAPESEQIILYQGALNEGRGLESAIQAMIQIDGATLWLVGEGDLSQGLRALVQDRQLQDKVKFWGFVAPHELPAMTAKATIGLNLLENKGLSYYYSLANKAFDYIQAGLPSLQMAFPEYNDLQEKYGVFELVTDIAPATIAMAIQSLLQDAEKMERIRQNCLLARQELNWEKESEKLLRFYENCFAP